MSDNMKVKQDALGHDLLHLYDLFVEKEDLLTDSVQKAVKNKRFRIKEIDDQFSQAFAIPGMYEKFQKNLSRQVKVRRHASIVRDLDKFIKRTGHSVKKSLVKDAIRKRHKLLSDFEVFSRVRYLELKEYREQLTKDKFEIIKLDSYKHSKYQIEQEAKKIMGRDFFGVEAIEKAFGIKLDHNFDIPKIPFSKERLKHAKLQNQFLILRIGKIGKQLLTMSKMELLLQPQFDKENKGRVLYNMLWYRNQVFFNDKSLKSCWALVSKEPIPNSTNKNYLEQTESLVKYLRSIFGKAIPSNYTDAISEFDEEKKSIKIILSSNLGEASERLSNLKINQMMRHNADEAFYDDVIYFQNTKKRLLKNHYAWTNTRSSCGRLVLVGPSDTNGVRLGYWEPVDFLPRFGVYVSIIL